MYKEILPVKAEDIIKIIERYANSGKISHAVANDIIHEIYEETSPNKFHKLRF